MRTISTTKNPTRATNTRREGEPEKSIATPLNSSFLKQIQKKAVAIYTAETNWTFRRLLLPWPGNPQCAATLQPHDPAVMKEQPGAPKQFSSHLGEETVEKNRELLAKIGSDSILKAPAIKGSIYFYINICSDVTQSKEELIDDPTALNAAIENLAIEIKYEN